AVRVDVTRRGPRPRGLRLAGGDPVVLRHVGGPPGRVRGGGGVVRGPDPAAAPRPGDPAGTLAGLRRRGPALGGPRGRRARPRGRARTQSAAVDDRRGPARPGTDWSRLG